MKRAIFALVLIVSLAFAGCASSGKSDTIKVGWFGALTGDQAVWGENEFNTVKMLFDMTEAEPLVMNFMLYAKHKEFLPGEPPICSSKPFALMRDMVKFGMEAGEIRRMDPMVASTSLFGGPIRMIMARLDGVLPVQLSRYFDEVWDCAWRSVAAT